MNSYDVLVIGGGPAGCAMALDLNRRGYDVALLDQAKFPPRQGVWGVHQSGCRPDS